ncbi:replication-associated recombination protein A [Portibacter marinus]|uniref:replication-associated recombination protein A n=1 Tax=Portibacter marinus TaxID=2898660 RepID=UPI001F41EB13|nr:replication-associated recombination protein A [Portibacter marinus]
MYNIPLAERMRPKNLDQYIGQNHLVGKNGVLRKSVESGRVPSMILWGPPGTGKTTLANIIAHSLERPFHALSAINSGVKDIRETIEKAKKQQFFGNPNPILFIDEIHRFSKSQQDALLNAVEKGIVTLIGATTENPSFEVIPALISRSQVYILEPLSQEELKLIVTEALAKDEFIKSKDVKIESFDALLRISGGDARKLLNALELSIDQFQKNENIIITDDVVANAVQNNLARYDKGGEQHYDIISAFIKSIRGSDPNATVYYLARMIEGGEDIKFIGRRMMISASEDIGLANPNALLMATSCFQAIQAVGLPEARIIMSQTAVYLAASPKSNSTYEAIKNAQSEVRKSGDLSIPLSLRNAPTTLMKSIGYGQDYKYAHSYEKNFIATEFLPESLEHYNFYKPGENASENRIAERLKSLWKDKYDF